MMRLQNILAALTALAAVAAASLADADSFRSVYSFPDAAAGSVPEGSLISVGGRLYGTTLLGGNLVKCSQGCGTVFSIDPASGTMTGEYAFKGSNGANPVAALLKVGSTLYGTTGAAGGAAGNKVFGTVFALNPRTFAHTVLVKFKFHGNGAAPQDTLIRIGDVLYGTTAAGGSRSCQSGCGTIFSLNLATGAEAVVYQFKAGADGFDPVAGLIDVNGTLYGVTENGGAFGGGTVFSFDPSTGVETVLHSFAGNPSDGAIPLGGLLKVGGKLYGTTTGGGTGSVNTGTVFSLSLTNGAEKVVHSFSAGTGDGITPEAGLIDVGGTLYGTTQSGGFAKGKCGFGCGTVFSLNPLTGAETVVHAFDINNGGGSLPVASLVDVGGTLYGTTSGGGTGNNGTVFAYTPEP